MNTLDATTWKEIAWNGISFMVPENWEVGKIGLRYLVLETKARPVLELKWARITGEFSHNRHFRHLAALHEKDKHLTLRDCSLPPEWEKALNDYEVSAFQWEGKTIGGMGVIVYCPTCLTATLIQFYQRDFASANQVSQKILTSFQDHRSDDRTVWSIYDIRATIPAEFNLSHYRFDAGQFELDFVSRNQTVALKRWGPASVLLADRNLLQFVEAQNQIPKIKANLQMTAEDKTIEGNQAPYGSGWSYLLSRLVSKTPFQIFRFWHLEEKNRILGVRLEGKSPVSSQFFYELCAGYESL